MTCFAKQGPRYLLYLRDSVLEEYRWVCIVKKELVQVYLPQKSDKGEKNEKVMAYFYLSPRKFCHYDYLVPVCVMLL